MFGFQQLTQASTSFRYLKFETSSPRPRSRRFAAYSAYVEINVSSVNPRTIEDTASDPVPVEDLDVAVALEGQDVRRDAVEEEAVVRDDEHRPCEAQDRLLQRAQRADVQVVRGLVEYEDIAALPHDRSQLGPVPLAARKIFYLLRLFA